MSEVNPWPWSKKSEDQTVTTERFSDSEAFHELYTICARLEASVSSLRIRMATLETEYINLIEKVYRKDEAQRKRMERELRKQQEEQPEQILEMPPKLARKVGRR